MQQLNKKEVLIPGSMPQKPITADISYIDGQGPKPLIVIAHGFKGFKDWGPWPLLSEEIAVKGFCCCKFNFSHNGVRPENLTELSDPKAFGYNNFSKELEDLDRLLDYLDKHKEQFQVDMNRIYLVGHSRGGGISIIKASEDTRIKKLATWASVYDFSSYFTAAELMYWKTHGVVYIKNSRTGENYPMYYQFVEDFLKNEERFVIEKALAKVSQPMLIVHGTNDETVNINAAFQLNEWKPDSTLHIIEKASHTLGAKHPHTDATLPDDLQNALNRTLEFFKA